MADDETKKEETTEEETPVQDEDAQSASDAPEADESCRRRRG